MVQRLNPYLVSVAILLSMAAYLLWVGRAPICTCGYVRLWYGETGGSQNSQHLTDWYSLTHVVHGLLLYAGIWLVARRLAFGWRLAIATLVEAAWEILENSDRIIERYRAVTVSQDYFGDSVINSVGDIAAMMLGFSLARVLPVRVSVVLAVIIEVLLAWTIRDGLVLNVLMLVWPLEAIRVWQAGG